MASFQRHIGPWPIKRSQSVPDTSAPIFTPRNSPPSLERLLMTINEDLQQTRQALSTSCTETMYSGNGFDDFEKRSAMDLERNEVVEKSHKMQAETYTKSCILQMSVTLSCGMGIFTLLPTYIAEWLQNVESDGISSRNEATSLTRLKILITILMTTSGIVWAVAATGLKMEFEQGLSQRSNVWTMFTFFSVIGVLLANRWLLELL